MNHYVIVESLTHPILTQPVRHKRHYLPYIMALHLEMNGQAEGLSWKEETMRCFALTNTA